MKMTQITLVNLEVKKQPNMSEKTEEVTYLFPAKKERLLQNRLDSYSMQGLKHVNRYTVYNLGELENKDFSYFYDETGEKYKILSIQANIDLNQWTIEGVVADGI